MGLFDAYRAGAEVLGEDRAILVKVRNTDQLARAQGGVAVLAAGLAPDTVNQKVNAEIAKRLDEALRKQNVDASVQVVEPSAGQKWHASSSPIWRSVVIGLGITAASVLAGTIVWKVARR